MFKSNPTGPRGTHLWEFIRDILLNPERNPGLIKWEDRTEGVFRFLKSEAVAQLWGKKKNNSSMTYEKLSRAMRYGSDSRLHTDNTHSEYFQYTRRPALTQGFSLVWQ